MSRIGIGNCGSVGSATALNPLEVFAGLGGFIFLAAVGIGLMVWLISRAQS